jgi:hypothetical protein
MYGYPSQKKILLSIKLQEKGEAKIKCLTTEVTEEHGGNLKPKAKVFLF